MFVSALCRQAVYATVLIETWNEQGSGVGTGFAFKYSNNQIFLVTNKHVLENSHETNLIFVKKAPTGEPLVGEFVEIVIDNNDFGNLWFSHKNTDICVARFQDIEKMIRFRSTDEPYVWPIPIELVPEQSDWAKDVVIGDEVLFFGYPDGIYDSYNIRPLVRRGILSTALELDFDDDTCVLIDAAVFPGSSGSPVFSVLGGGRLSGNPVVFIGVVSHAWYSGRDRRPANKPIPNSWNKNEGNSLNLGTVIKAHNIVETIDNYYKNRKSILLRPSGYQIKWKPAMDMERRPVTDLNTLADEVNKYLAEEFHSEVIDRDRSSVEIRLTHIRAVVLDRVIFLTLKRKGDRFVLYLRAANAEALSAAKEALYKYCSDSGGQVMGGPVFVPAHRIGDHSSEPA